MSLADKILKYQIIHKTIFQMIQFYRYKDRMKEEFFNCKPELEEQKYDELERFIREHFDKFPNIDTLINDIVLHYIHEDFP